MSILRDIKIIEAILFASGEPVSEDDLKDKMLKNQNLIIILKKLKNIMKIEELIY